MKTNLYQIELDQTAVNCGMSYVFHLQNDDFIIIDGGYFSPGEEDRLYQFLANNSDRKIPVVAGWYFSHAHQDHIGTFINFIRKYRSEVKIEKLLYAFHPVDLSSVSGDWRSSDPATIKEFYRTLDVYCQGIAKVDLHTGDKIEFGELTMDVIYTYEDLYPENASFNDYSTVITTTVGRQKILWLGDISFKGANILLKNPVKLKCDIFQVAHHGIDNHDILCELYAATEAKVALWPTPDYGMNDRKEQTVNDFILNKLNIKEHFVSGFGTVKLPLPYKTGMAVKEEKKYSFERQPDNIEELAENVRDKHALRYVTPKSFNQ